MTKKPGGPVFLAVLIVHWIVSMGGAAPRPAYPGIPEPRSGLSAESRTEQFSLDTGRELALLGAGSAFALTGRFLHQRLEPLTLEKISTLKPNDVNAFDRAAIGRLKSSAVDDLMLYGSFLFPLAFLLNQDTRNDFGRLAVMAGETALIRYGLTAVFKNSFGRIRPYVYDESTPLDEKLGRNPRLSFFSGHTAAAAAMTFFTAKVFSYTLTDDAAKALIWTGAVLYPAVTGWLRVRSANHWPTDVIAGFAAGALIGYVIPSLHRKRERDLSGSDPKRGRDMVFFTLRFSF